MQVYVHKICIHICVQSIYLEDRLQLVAVIFSFPIYGVQEIELNWSSLENYLTFFQVFPYFNPKINSNIHIVLIDLVFSQGK